MEVKVSQDVAADPDAVWARIGDPGSIAAWHPAVESSGLDATGRIRTAVLADGATVIEEITTRGARSYTYTIVEAPLPITGYVATLRVEPCPAGARVTWEARFELLPGAPAAVADLVRDVFTAGLAAVAQGTSAT